MKYLVAAVLGLLVGALLAFQVANALSRRHAFGRAVMLTQRHHFADLREALDTPNCPNAASLPALQRLAAVTPDTLPAFADDLGKNPGFGLRQQALGAALGKALASPPNDCTALNAVVREIDDACEACHHEYR